MRKIKFRGKRKDNGEVVAGEDFKFVRVEVYISDGTNWFEVDTESVAQFVGYDKTGAEVYDDDCLINEYGTIIAANKIAYDEIGSKFNNFTLKEK